MRTLTDVTRQIDETFTTRLAETLRREPAGAVQAALAELGTEPSNFLEAPTTLESSRLLELLHHLNAPDRLPGVCLRFGLSRRILDLGLLGYAALSCSTIGDAIHVICRYHDLTSDAYDMRMTDEDGAIVVQLLIRPSHRAFSRVIAEEFSTGLWQVLAELIDDPGELARLRVAYGHPPPDYAAEYSELMSGEIRFDQERSSIALPQSWSTFPVHTADETIELVCRAQCDQLMEGLTPGPRIVDDVRQTILSAPSNQPARLAAVARELAVSSRTLERRLHQAGTSFRQVAGEVRMQLAAQYVGLGTMSTDEASRMLGYSQAPAFFRAFKQWYGMTPKQYRELRDFDDVSTQTSEPAPVFRRGVGERDVGTATRNPSP